MGPAEYALSRLVHSVQYAAQGGVTNLRVFLRRVTSSLDNRLRVVAIIVGVLLVCGLGSWRIFVPASSSAELAAKPILASEPPSPILARPGLLTDPTTAKKATAKATPKASKSKAQHTPSTAATGPAASTGNPSSGNPSPGSPSGLTGNPSSNLVWASGVSYPSIDAYSDAAANATSAFGAWRGKSVGVAEAWPEISSWDDFTEPNSFYSTLASQSYTKVFALPPYPANIGDTITGCIAGDYDQYWQTFAQTMQSSGLAAQGTIIRLGWEMNQHTDWGTPSQFAACWRNIVSTVNAIAPGLQWDWNVNRGSSGDMPGSSILSAYPGNAYVNIIGVDSYDMWPPVDTSGGWQQQLNGPYGLNYWLNFAESNGKKLSVPEWGLTANTDPAWDGHSGGDDPAYIEDMYNFFVANSANIAFESYFDFPGDDNSLYNPSQDPNSAAEYTHLWSSGG
jgi:hypothetical protein